MKPGTLYGLGVGPGDPEWIPVKAVRILAACQHVFVPRARAAADSVALDIARIYLRPDAVVHELTFPMSSDAQVLDASWRQAAEAVCQRLDQGDDAAFLTLGDPLLYSTYIYLLRSVRQLRPEIDVVTVPGITAFSAAAALANTPIGQGKQLVTIVPASDDLDQFERALDRGGTVILMKIGDRLPRVLDVLQARGLLARGVFVARAGMPHQQVETDLTKLRDREPQTGYLSILIVQA